MFGLLRFRTFLLEGFPLRGLNPKLSEPGAVEQGERAEAGRRGSSGAQSPPVGDRASPAGSCGLRSMPGRPLANNPSGRPRNRSFPLVGTKPWQPQLARNPVRHLQATKPLLTPRTPQGLQASQKPPRGLPLQEPLRLMPSRSEFASIQDQAFRKKLGASSQTQSQTFCSSPLVQGLIASKKKASSQAQPNIAPSWSTRVEETKKEDRSTRDFFWRTSRIRRLEETGGLEPTPNPNLVSSGLDRCN